MLTIKKSAALLLALLLLLSCGVFAEGVNYQPGETFDATFTLTDNPNQAVACTMKLNYDHSVFELIPSGFAQNDGAFMLDLNGIAEGTSGTASFRVLPGAADGDYTIFLDVVEAGDINEKFVDGMQFSSVIIHVGQSAEKPRKSNRYFSDGKLYIAYDYNEQGFLAWRTTYNRYGKIANSWTALEFDGDGNAVKYKIHYPSNSGKYSEYIYEAAYDSRGNEIAYTSYNKDGTQSSRAEKTYDQNDHVIRVLYYNAEGALESIQQDYTYNQDGKVTGYTRLKADGSVDYYYQAEWSGGMCVKYSNTNPAGEVYSHGTCDPVYGDTLTWYYADESYSSEGIYTYGPDGYEEEYTSHGKNYYDEYRSVSQFDTQDRCIKRTSYDENGQESGVSYYEYGDNGAYTETYYSSYNSRSVDEYDENGNRTVHRYYSDDGTYDYVAYYQYDARGNEIESKEYDLNGNLKSYTEKEYDAQGRETRTVSYEANGKKSSEKTTVYTADGKGVSTSSYYYSDGSYSVTEYDENGKSTRYSRYTSAGALDSYTLYEYNENGKAVRENKYDGKNQLTGYTTYEYNARGDTTEWVEYNAKGEIEYRYVYQYDSQGRQERTTAYHRGVISWDTQYRYDADGTQHEKTDYYSNGTISREGEWN